MRTFCKIFLTLLAGVFVIAQVAFGQSFLALLNGWRGKIKPKNLKSRRSYPPRFSLVSGAALVILVSFASNVPLFAQYTTASLGGAVTDPSGAAVPDARLTIANEKTGLTKVTTTQSDGSFVFPALPVGSYRLTVEKEGFSAYVQEEITLVVEQAANLNITLKVGAVTQAVTVSGHAELVATRSAAVGQLVDQKRIVDLPLNGREAQSLVFLLPGTVDTTDQHCGGECGGNMYPGEQFAAANGSSVGTLNYQLDGAGNNDTYLNVNLPFPNPDSLQEFSLQSGNLSAQYGNSASGTISIVTKSGTNQVHGSLFEFLRNGSLNARNFFAPTQDTLKRNQFGGSVGGPIKKEKLFYFGTFQATRIRSAAQGQVAFVPTMADLAGDLSDIPVQLNDPVTGIAFPGNQVPLNRLSPGALNWFKHVPLPNGPGHQLTFAGPSLVENNYEWMTKLDYIRGKHQISGRYSFFNHTHPPFFASQNILAADSNGSDERVQNLAVNDTFSATPSLLFNTSFGLDQLRGGSRSSAPFSWADLGIKLAGPTPPETNVWVSGYFSVFTNHFGDFDRGDWTIREDVTKIKGAHELHLGGELVRVKNHITNTWNMAGYFNFNGALSGDNLADFLLGRVPFFQQGGGEFKKMHGTRVGIYGQDNWRVGKKLTLNLGLRWDPYLPYVEDLKRGACFVPGKKSKRYPNAPLGFLFIGGQDQDLGCPANHSWPNLGNFAPRVGFAYRLTQDGKTSIRGGTGIYYIHPMTTQFNADANVAPFAPTFNFSDVSLDDPWGSIGIPSPFPAQFGPTIPAPDATFILPSSIRWYFPPDFHSSTLYTWNLTLEREVGREWLLRAAYVGNKGTFLSNGLKAARETDPAIYIPGQSTTANTQQRRIYTDFTTIGLYSSDSNSHYNALQLGVEKRVGRGLSVLANYTWSKAIDDYGASNPFNRKFDYGKSDEDIPHLFKFSNIWQIPTPHMKGIGGKVLNGWEVNSILIWRSGFPFSILSGRDNSFSAVGRDRADFTGTNLAAAQLGSGRPHAQLVQRWFDTSVWAPNAVGTFGNTGRNILRGPRSFDTDLGLLKTTQVTERMSIQFRSEFFNIFNNVNFRNPGGTLGGGDFGRLTSALDPRIIQFGLKVLF